MILPIRWSSRLVCSLLVGVLLATSPESHASLLNELETVMPAVVNLEITGPLHVHKGKKGKIHPAKSRGSGFIVSETGLILTNEHVVGKAKTIHVHFQDGTRRVAQRIGLDREADVALLQVDLSGLVIQPLELEVEANVEPGMQVIAIGNPKGLHHSVSAGIISGLHRDSIRPRKGHRYSDFIQTDAAINKGSSGGPLLNAKGKVVGMVTAIKKNSDGLAFAIPSTWLNAIFNRLKEGDFQRSWLGVSLAEMERGPQTNEGTRLEVKRVVADSPAAKGSLQVGDQITHAFGKPVVSVSGFSFDVSMVPPGEALELGLRRAGEQMSVSIPVDVRAAGKKKSRSPTGSSLKRMSSRPGVSPWTHKKRMPVCVSIPWRMNPRPSEPDCFPMTPLSLWGRENSSPPVDWSEQPFAPQKPGSLKSKLYEIPVGTTCPYTFSKRGYGLAFRRRLRTSLASA